MIFLLYVAYAVPVRTAFEITVEVGSLWFVVDAFIDVYFILDVVLGFRTAVVLPNGMLEVDRWLIAKNYVRRWFLIDFVSCLPVNYYFMIAYPDEDASQYRSLRMVRLLRLLRLARLKRIVGKYQDSFDLAPVMSLVFTLFSILFAAHLMACVWWMIGTTPGERLDVLANGTEVVVAVQPWAEQDELWCGSSNEQLDSCMDRIDLNAVPLGTRYIRSMFSIFEKWSVNTELEATFAVCSELITGFIYGGLAGVMSTIMMSSGAGDQEQVHKLIQLKAWMKSKDMPKRHRMKILAHFTAQQEGGGGVDEREILESLPPSLSSEISYHLYYDVLKNVPIFKGIGEEVGHHLCRLMRPMSCRKDQVIFAEGSIGTSMFIIVSGEVEISLKGERLGYLGVGAFVGEQPIIDIVTGKGGDGSEVRSRTVTAFLQTELVFIESAGVQELLDQYPELRIRLGTFQRVGKKLGDKGNTKYFSLRAKLTATMKTAVAARDAGRLAEPERLADAQKHLEAAAAIAESAARLGGRDDAALARLQLAETAVEDALGVTKERSALVSLIVRRQMEQLRGGTAASHLPPLPAAELAALPLRSLHKRAEAIGVPAEQRAEAARISPALVPTVPAEEKAPGAQSNPWNVQARSDPSVDGAEVLRLLSAMKAQQDGMVAELSALRLEVTELRGA